MSFFMMQTRSTPDSADLIVKETHVKDHYQVRDTRTHSALPGCEAMMIDDMARAIAQRMNRKSRAKSPRYVIIRVDPASLPVYGVPHDPADAVPEFA